MNPEVCVLLLNRAPSRPLPANEPKLSGIPPALAGVLREVEGVRWEV
jgi:hypothetical protein